MPILEKTKHSKMYSDQQKNIILGFLKQIASFLKFLLKLKERKLFIQNWKNLFRSSLSAKIQQFYSFYTII